jgi:hypothetical protein
MEGIVAKKTKKEYTILVKRDVLFEAKIKANTLDEALELANSMSADDLWMTPGDITDDERKITAVFES